MRARRRLAVIAAISTATMALAACGGGGDGDDPATTAEALPNTGWISAEADEIQDGGSLTLAIDSPITNFNYYNADAGTVDSNDVSQMFLPSLITLAEDGSWEPDPNYATSIEVTSEDPQVVTVDLNPDAHWSDGTPMTAADWIGMFPALSGAEPEYAPNSTNIWSDMSSVEEGESEFQVVFTYANQNADWVSMLSYPLPTWVTESPDAFNTAWQALPVAADGETIISGGPFIVDSYDQNAGVMTFARNPEWWGETPKLDTVVFRVVDRASAGQAFANNELDAVEINASVDTLNAVQERADAQILASRGTTYSHITLNGTTGVFSDIAVRQAFAMSIDREIVTQAAVEPLGVEPEVLNNLIFLPGQDGYTDDSAPIAYDPEAAGALLDEAGWTLNDDGIRELDGETLTVRLVIPSENPNSSTIAQQIQPMAAEVGFDVQIDTVPSDDFFTEYVTVEDRDFDATLFAWQGTAFPISSTESIFYPADSGQNYPGVTNEELGDMWTAANAELDPDARLELVAEIDMAIMTQAQTIPLFARPNQWAVAEGLVNLGPSQLESIDWTMVGWAAE